MKEQIFRVGYLRDKSRAVNPGGGSSGVPTAKIIDVTELPKEKWVNGTAVPASGFVTDVYFNTKLSNEEVAEMLSKLPYTDGACPIMIGPDGGWYLVAEKKQDDLGNDSYALGDFWHGDWYNEDGTLDKGLWNFPNKEDNSVFFGMPLNAPGKIFGDVLPNSGQIENIYFNMSITGKEVQEIFESLEYTVSPYGSKLLYYPAVGDYGNDNKMSICFIKETRDSGESIYTLQLNGVQIFSISSNNLENFSYGNWNYYSFSKTEQIGNITVGRKDFSGTTLLSTYEEEGTTFNVGTQNDKIKSLVAATPFDKTESPIEVQNNLIRDLVSITQFETTCDADTTAIYKLTDEKSGVIGLSGTTLPNDGEIGNVYFNKDLSAGEVLSILNSLEFTNSGSLGGDISVLLTDSNGNVVISVYKETNQFYLMVTNETAMYITFDLSEYQWNPNLPDYLELNCTAVPTVSSGYDNLPSGANNELVKNLISSTEFFENTKTATVQSLWGYNNGWLAMEPTEAEFPYWKGTPILPKEYVDTIYFNTSLNEEEVLKIIKSINSSYYYSVFSDTSQNKHLTINSNINYEQRTYSFGIIYENYETDEYRIIWADKDYALSEGLDYSGWQGIKSIKVDSNCDVFDFDYESNSYESNEFLSSLFSITPHELVDYYVSSFRTTSLTSLSSSTWKNENGWERVQNYNAYSKIYDNKTYTGPYMFNDITIPDGIEYISTNSLSYYYTEKITLPQSSKYIGYGAFSGTFITEIDIPDNVEFIGPYVFSNCHYLQKVKLPKKITTIYNNAFNACGSLRSIKIPENVSLIEGMSFAGCDNLQIVDMTELNAAPTLGDANAFQSYRNNDNLNCAFIIKSELADQFLNATNWSTFNGQFYDEKGNQLN